MRLPLRLTGSTSATALSLAALAAGLAGGMAISASGSPLLRAAGAVVEPAGALWVNAIRMTLVPLVVSLLIVSISGFADTRSVGRLGARTLALFAVLLAGVAVFAVVVAPPLFRHLRIDPAAAAALRARAAPPAALPELPTLRGFIVGLVPTNPLRAAADGAMLPLIAFTLLFALAITRLPGDSRALVTAFFRAVSQAMLIIVRWILRLTPIGVFALAVGMGTSLGLAAAGAVGWYVLVECGMALAVTVALYPVAALCSRRSMREFARACAPAQAVAAGTRSSLASLPALIEGARREYGDRPGIAGFVLPLAVSTFKLNTPILNLVGPLFLARLYGISLSTPQLAAMALIAIAISFGSPGIPSGSFFVVTAPVALSAGIPLEGIGLLIAADAIPDIFSTINNVTGDMAVATILEGRVPEAPVAPGDATLAPPAAPSTRGEAPRPAGA